MNSRFLLRVPLVVLPLFFACGSSSTKPAASPADKTEQAALDEDDRGDTKGDKAVGSDDDGKKGASDKSDKESASKSDDKGDGAQSNKKAAADEGDDKGPVDDSRTTASIANVIKENRKAFKKCYEDVRKEQPELKGNVLLKIVLDGAGKVKKAYVDNESSIRNQKVVDCMIKLAQSLTYPKSSKGLDKDFEYDFGFNNQTQ